MPVAIKFAMCTALAALIAGAAYLMVARGPAILIDLGGALAGCF
jgi:hypothetical protein